MKSLAYLAIAVTAPSACSGEQPAKVVFVCEHGAARSVIAAAELKRLAKEKGPAVEVVARGTIPDAEVAAGVRQGLLADGMEIGPAKPIKVSAKDLEGASRVVSFGPDLGPWLPRGQTAADWSATPSPSEDYRAARQYILRRVEALIGEMQRTPVR